MRIRLRKLCARWVRENYSARSISIFFFSASSFVMRKLRIWPVFGSSRLGPESPDAGAPAPPPFHLLASMEESVETSTEDARCLLLLLRLRHVEVRLHALAQFHRDPVALHVRNAARDHFAFFMLGDVFIERSRLQLLQAQPQTALFAIVFEHDARGPPGRPSARPADG